MWYNKFIMVGEFMNNKEYLNEEQYQQNVKKLKKTGKIVLIVGICMLIVGFIFTVLGVMGFGKTGINAISGNGIALEKTAKGIFGGFGLVAFGGFLDMTGSFVTAVGVIIMFIAHRREITAFTTQQVLPVGKEGIEKISPSISIAAKEIAKGIKEGLNEADKK